MEVTVGQFQVWVSKDAQFFFGSLLPPQKEAFWGMRETTWKKTIIPAKVILNPTAAADPQSQKISRAAHPTPTYHKHWRGSIAQARKMFYLTQRVFLLWRVNMVDYIDRFLNTEPALLFSG